MSVFNKALPSLAAIIQSKIINYFILCVIMTTATHAQNALLAQHEQPWAEVSSDTHPFTHANIFPFFVKVNTI